MSYVKPITYWLLIGIIAIFFLKYTSFVDINWIIILPIIAIGIIVSVYHSIKNDKYISETISLKTNNRTPVYDYIRVIAVFLVICVHTLTWDLSMAASLDGSRLFVFLDKLRFWCLNCNLLFIMISGALLLPYKEENILAFYKKRIIRIAIPLVVYFIWYLWQYDMLSNMSIIDVVICIFTADNDRCHVPHFWLIYRILILYLVIPFLRITLKKFTYKKLSLLSVFILLILFIAVYSKMAEYDIIDSICWILVAILGYWIIQQESRRFDTINIFLGALATIILFIADVKASYFEMLTNNLSILRVLICVGIFSLFFIMKERLVNFYFIRIVSKYSYGIMLIHMWVLYFVTRRIISISSVMYHGLGLLISSFVTLIVSLFTVYLIDNLIITSIIAAFTLRKSQ